MFNTFKYDPETRQVQQLRSAFDPVTARSNQHQACNNCHSKKLRCSGEKSGCERCIASSLVCEYTRSSSRPSRRRGSTSGKKSSSSDGAPAGDSSPSSGAQSRILTPSPTPLEHGQEAITPRPRLSQLVPLAPGTAAPLTLPQDALGMDMDLQAFSVDFSQGPVDLMQATPAVYGAGGDSVGYGDFSRGGGMWQPSAQMGTLPPGVSASYEYAMGAGSGTETCTSPEEFFAMYPDLTQFPPDQTSDGRYWSGEQ